MTAMGLRNALAAERLAKKINAMAGKMVICEACYRENTKLRETLTGISCEDATDCTRTFAPELAAALGL